MMPHKQYMAEEVSSQQTPVENFENQNQEYAFQRPHYLGRNHYKGIDEIALGFTHNKCPYIDRYGFNKVCIITMI